MKFGVRLAIIVFAVVALAHLLRLAYGLEILVAGWPVPNWVSVIGVVGPLAIAWLLWKGK